MCENDEKQCSVGIELVKLMRSLMNVPYIYDGKNPHSPTGDLPPGLDCSGSVAWCMEKLSLVPKGWRYENNAENIRDYCISIAKAEAVPGDLVFYGSPTAIDHVVMYIGDNNVIGAIGGCRKCVTIEYAERTGACVKIMDVYYRKDLVEFRRIPISMSQA